jgi:4-amino-4-deoxy-L-arabinose transferase-like glycosyltransferase
VEGINTLWWAVCLYMVVRLVKEPTRRRWLLLGLVFGIGLLTKYAIAFLGVALAVGVVATPSRRLLKSPWPWLGVGVAVLVFLPNVVWQATHGWPFLEYARSIRTHMMDWIPLHLYLLFQVVYLGVPALPLWLGGLGLLLFAPSMRRYRLFGVAFLALLAILIAVGSKPYYPVPAYVILFAAGAVGAGRLFDRPGRAWLRAASVAALTALSVPFLPYSLPMLPIERFIAYSKVVYLAPAFTFETGRQIELPQYYADMFGWEEQVAAVARVFHSLPPEDRAKATIYADNYGEAGAVNLFGRKYGLPKAISGHFNYFYWGPGPGDPEIVITLGRVGEAGLRRDFGDVTRAATVHHPHAIFYENDFPIYVCRKPRVPLRELWPGTRDF